MDEFVAFSSLMLADSKLAYNSRCEVAPGLYSLRNILHTTDCKAFSAVGTAIRCCHRFAVVTHLDNEGHLHSETVRHRVFYLNLLPSGKPVSIYEIRRRAGLYCGLARVRVGA